MGGHLHGEKQLPEKGLRAPGESPNPLRHSNNGRSVSPWLRTETVIGELVLVVVMFAAGLWVCNWVAQEDPLLHAQAESGPARSAMSVGPQGRVAGRSAADSATKWTVTPPAAGEAASPTIDQESNPIQVRWRPAWIRHVGSKGFDHAGSVAAIPEDGGCYVAGYTTGDGPGPEGEMDAFVLRCDRDGNVIWKRRLGTKASDYAVTISVSGDGGCYVGGWTQGSMSGSSMGDMDAFLVKMAADGQVLWTRQFGSARADVARAIASDGKGNCWVAGWTRGPLAGAQLGDADAFIAKWDSTGALMWSRQFGTSAREGVEAIGIDGKGNCYVAGDTEGRFGGVRRGAVDTFVTKYDTDGIRLWVRQFGTGQRHAARGMAVQADGTSYVAGHSVADSAEATGAARAMTGGFVITYARSGSMGWGRQFQPAATSFVHSVATDTDGNCYVLGWGAGAEGAEGPASYVASWDRAGMTRWVRRVPTKGTYRPNAIAVDDRGQCYLIGSMAGDADGAATALDDMFIMALPITPGS